MNEKAATPDYGLDAPGVVRNLVLGGVTGLTVWGSAALGLWSGFLHFNVGGTAVELGLAGTGLGFAVLLLPMALWMTWSSKVGKVRGRETLLDAVAWRGDEQVLDVGCGRGLLLVGAARRLKLPGGKATGIDIWQAEDLAGNRPEATLENARREGVLDRVEVKTADMRKLPFADGAVDVVVSKAAIHNLYESADRAAAIREIARVLKPGGHALIDDIRHGSEYEQIFAKNRCSTRRLTSRGSALFWAVLTFGSLRPAILIATKAP